MRLLAAAAFATLAIAPAFAADPVIDKIEARLFLTATGELSANVADGSGVGLWNTIIGEGDFGPANDTVVIVTVKGDAGAYIETPLEITITGSDGKPVTSRKVEGMLTRETGLVSTAVFVPDSTCNQLTIKATIGKSEKTIGVPFACGE